MFVGFVLFFFSGYRKEELDGCLFFGKMMMMITPAEAARKHTERMGDEGGKMGGRL